MKNLTAYNHPSIKPQHIGWFDVLAVHYRPRKNGKETPFRAYWNGFAWKVKEPDALRAGKRGRKPMIQLLSTNVWWRGRIDPTQP